MASQRPTGDLLEMLEKQAKDLRKIKRRLGIDAQARDDIDNLSGYQIGMKTDQLFEGVTGFTNDTFADLDALTAAAFSRGVSVTVETDTDVLVIISNHILEPQSGGEVFLGYRISGAHTASASNSRAARNILSDNSNLSVTYVDFKVGLTSGTNTFELQARHNGATGEGQLYNPSITVIPLN